MKRILFLLSILSIMVTRHLVHPQGPPEEIYSSRETYDTPFEVCECITEGMMCDENVKCCGGLLCNKSNKCKPASYQDLKTDLLIGWNELCSNPAVDAAWNNALSNLQEIVSTDKNPIVTISNPWIGSTCREFGLFMDEWLTFLPTPINGFKYIQLINYFERDNPDAIFFLNKLTTKSGTEKDYCPEVFDWTTR